MVISKMIGGVRSFFPHFSVAALDAGGKIYQVSQLFPGPRVGESTTIQTYQDTPPPDDERAATIAEMIEYPGQDGARGLRLQASLATGTKPDVLSVLGVIARRPVGELS